MLEILRKFGLPINASEHGGEIDATIGYVHWLMLILFIGWGTFFVYTLFRFRRSRNPKADYRGVKGHYSSWVEVGVAVIEAVLLIGFSIPLWAKRVDEFPDEAKSTLVNVIAQQFAWNMHYPGPDGVFGPRDITRVNESNVIGLDREDPAAADDVVSINQLNLPVDKDVVIHLSTMDVIHSFFLPEMRVKQDAIPGMSIPLHFKPVMTSEQMREAKIESGVLDPEKAALHNYTIACAQLCGLGHYRMRGVMTIQSQEEFDAWYQEQLEFSATGEDEWGEDEWGEEGDEEAVDEGAEEEMTEEVESEEAAPEEVEETVEESEAPEEEAIEEATEETEAVIQPASPEASEGAQP
jgi:cytochrome c oxidase subunit 2